MYKFDFFSELLMKNLIYGDTHNTVQFKNQAIFGFPGMSGGWFKSIYD